MIIIGFNDLLFINKMNKNNFRLVIMESMIDSLHILTKVKILMESMIDIIRKTFYQEQSSC